MIEEFRAPIIDRLVLRLINRKEVQVHHFEIRPGGAVAFTEAGRKRVLDAHQKRKHEEVQRPLLKSAVPIGLLPYWQATVLARTLRGDLEVYRPWLAST